MMTSIVNSVAPIYQWLVSTTIPHILPDITLDSVGVGALLLISAQLGALAYRARGGWFLPFGTFFARAFYSVVYTLLFAGVVTWSKLTVPVWTLVALPVVTFLGLVLFSHGAYQCCGQEAERSDKSVWLFSFLNAIPNLFVRDFLGLFFNHAIRGVLISALLFSFVPGMVYYPLAIGLGSALVYYFSNWVLSTFIDIEAVWPAELGVGAVNTLALSYLVLV